MAGLVIHEAQMIPTIGQCFSFHGFRFEVVARDNNRITALKIRPSGPGIAPERAKMRPTHFVVFVDGNG